MQGRLNTVADPAGLLARGLAVFPLPAGAKAAPAGWHEHVTTDPAAVAAWPAGANIGVACRASGIVGLDLDRKDDVDGVDTLRALYAAARRPWPATLTVATAHGGLHLYFHAPAGANVPSSIGRWPGVDVRAPGHHLGGYLVGPGSLVDGRPYTITRDVPIAPLPRWLTVRLTGRRTTVVAAAAAVAAASTVTRTSRPYPRRSGDGVTLYLDAELSAPGTGPAGSPPSA